METKVKFFPEKKLGILKFTGDIEVEDILSLLTVTYEADEYPFITHSILDFRNCTFQFSHEDVAKTVELVRRYSFRNKHVKTALLVKSPKVTALAQVFQRDLGVPEKLIGIYSTPEHLLYSFNLPLTEEELEEMIRGI